MFQLTASRARLTQLPLDKKAPKWKIPQILTIRVLHISQKIINKIISKNVKVITNFTA